MLLEVVIIERDPVTGGGLYLAIPHERKAMGKADVAGLGIARSLVDVISHRKEDSDPQQKY